MARSEVHTVTAVTGGRGASEEHDRRPPRTIAPGRGLPGGRAVVGALLMAVAAVGVFVAYADATAGPVDDLVVAARAIRMGEEISAGDVRVVRADLPGPTRRRSFSSTRELIGRVALAPIGEGEIVQAGAITADDAAAGGHEVAITLPRDQVAVGRLKEGERVDVFVTYDERTTSVVRGAQVVQIASTGDGSLTSDREIGVVVVVPSGEVVAALVHALRTGDVTVVRSTFAGAGDEAPLEFEAAVSDS